MHAEFSYDFLWIALLGLLTTPLVIAAIVYALLGNIKSVLARAFYSSVIGAIYAAATPVIWEFRTNAESHATMVFGIVATITTLAAIVILTWLARRTVR
jgi:RsiW-degrading membrane proteinase PrsW (M82 family)